MEAWKDLFCSDYHEVSSHGRLRNKLTGRFLHGSKTKNGYILTSAKGSNGKRVQFYVHYAVARAFVGDRPEGHHVSHKDGNKQNNSADNLAYETPVENIARKHDHGTVSKGEHRHNSKLTEKDVIAIRASRKTATELASEYGVSESTIYRARNNKLWKHVVGCASCTNDDKSTAQDERFERAKLLKSQRTETLQDLHYTQEQFAQSQQIAINSSVMEHVPVRERRAKEYQQEMIDLVYDLGLSRSENLLNVHRTTIQRWMRGITRTPESAILTLRAAAKGQLPGQTDLHWVGWKFGQDGNLYSPAGQTFHSGDLLAQQYERALIHAQQQEIAQLRSTVEKLTGIVDRLTPAAANDKAA